MEAFIRHTFALLLTLCVLLGSVGTALSERLCNLTAFRPALEQEQPVGCCKKSSDTSDIEAEDCCTLELTFEKLEPVSAQKAFQLEVPVFFPMASPSFAPHRVPDGSFRQHTLAFSDSSPPRAGRQLLHFIHILVI